MEFSESIRTVRLFIALPISGEIKKRCEELQQVGKEKIPSVRWVDPKQIHLTLVFLGWTDPTLRDRIGEAIQETTRSQPPFTLRVIGMGVFPKVQAPKIIWVGVSEEAALMRLQKELAGRIDRLGLPVETRPYRPHLTLGRVREGGVPDQDWFSRWIAGEKGHEIGTCEMTEVALMESRSSPGGSVYNTLLRSELGMK